MDFGRYIAHRGLHSLTVPENSLTSFVLAAEKGIAAELDVRLTKDMKLVVFHDESLKRMCGVDVKLSDLTYDELLKYKLSETEEHIPLLKDVLKAIGGRVPVLIEIKRGAPRWVTEKRLHRLLEGCKSQYAVQSFDPISLLWFRLFDRKTPRGMLVSEKGGNTVFEKLMLKLCAKPFVWKLIADPSFVSYDLKCITLEKVFAVIDRGADLFTWTADTPELIEAAGTFSKTVIAENFPEGFDFNN